MFWLYKKLWIELYVILFILIVIVGVITCANNEIPISELQIQMERKQLKLNAEEKKIEWERKKIAAKQEPLVNFKYCVSKCFNDYSDSGNRNWCTERCFRE